MKPVDEPFEIPIVGMTCTGCAARVERALCNDTNVRRAEVNFALRRAMVWLTDPETTLPRLLETIASAGYEPAANTAELLARRGSSLIAQREREAERKAARHAVAALAIAAVQMVVGMPIHSKRVASHSHAASFLASNRLGNVAFDTAMLVSTLVVMYLARSLYVRAWRALKERSADMNTLVALGSGTAFLYSALATFFPDALKHGSQRADIHFETASFIVAFVLLGRSLESRARARLASSQAELIALVPAFATVVRRGESLRVASTDVQEGDTCILRPGSRSPADGVVVPPSAPAFFDESMLTGESRRVRKQAGDVVHAGTLCIDGLVHMRATSVGNDTRIARLAALVRDAQSTRAPIARLADRISGWFTVAIVAVATLAAGLWWIIGDEPAAAHAAAVFVTVVVVSCPCALGLATPTAIATAIGTAAKLGLLVRSGEALERLAHVDTIALDKTGTLTEGTPELVQFALMHNTGIDADTMLHLAATVESASEHPIGQAIVKAAKSKGIAIGSPAEFSAVPGHGVYATVGARRVCIGSPRWVHDQGALMTDSKNMDDTSNKEKASFVMAVDGAVCAFGIVADRPRKGAAQAIASLRSQHIHVLMLTGDRSHIAQSVARELGIDDVRAECSPEHKREVLAQLAQQGHRVAMCGDGINDAPALASAYVGIAMGGGTDAAAEASDLTLIGGTIDALGDAIALSRATLRCIRQNLAWAFAYNLALVPIAAGALTPFGVTLPPALAAAAMGLSSLSVVLNSLRLRRFHRVA